MTEDKIIKNCEKYNIENWTLNPQTNLIDVDNDVNLYNKNLTKLPLPFGDVHGFFNCGNNKLTSLEYSPKNVGDAFSCSNNKLTSLAYSPENIGGSFNCRNNKISSLRNLFFNEDGQSKNIKIGGNLYCSLNPIPIYEYRWWFLGTMKGNVVDGKIYAGYDDLNDFLNKNKAPDAKEIPNLFTELRKFEK